MAINNYKLKSRNVKLLLIVCLLVVSSCLWQKRVYNKGYYVSKNHSLKKTEEKTNADTTPSFIGSIKPAKVKEVPVTLSAEISNHQIVKSSNHQIAKLLIDACDTLFLRNGAQILVKIIDVNSEKVKYTFCDSPNKFYRTINKADIAYIVYANGYKEVYDGRQQGQAQTQYSNGNNNYKSHTISPTAITGLIFLILGILLILLLYAALSAPASVTSGIGCLAVLGAFFGIIFILVGIILLIIALVSALST
ncbi:MAG: hypothetical protein ACYDCN_02405 [Bacteroidia bacterium]